MAATLVAARVTEAKKPLRPHEPTNESHGVWEHGGLSLTAFQLHGQRGPAAGTLARPKQQRHCVRALVITKRIEGLRNRLVRDHEEHRTLRLGRKRTERLEQARSKGLCAARHTSRRRPVLRPDREEASLGVVNRVAKAVR